MVRRPHGHVCVCRVCISRCDRASSVVFLVPGDEACRGGARRNSKHGGGARDGGRGPGEARAVFTFVSVRNLDILYIIPPRNRGSRARSSKHPLRALPQLSASTAHRRDPGVPGVRGEWPRRELTRTSAGLKMCRERKEARTCVCGARVDSLRSRTDHTPQPTLSRLAVALGQ